MRFWLHRPQQRRQDIIAVIRKRIGRGIVEIEMRPQQPVQKPSVTPSGFSRHADDLGRDGVDAEAFEIVVHSGILPVRPDSGKLSLPRISWGKYDFNFSLP